MAEVAVAAAAPVAAAPASALFDAAPAPLVLDADWDFFLKRKTSRLKNEKPVICDDITHFFVIFSLIAAPDPSSWPQELLSPIDLGFSSVYLKII